MRKITKALALALCICLLSGVAAFVFAAPGEGAPTPTQLNITNDSHNIVNDFNFSTEDYRHVYMQTGSDPDTQILGMDFEQDYDTAGQKRGAAAAGTNKYIYPVAPFMVPTDTSANGNGLLRWSVNAANAATVDAKKSAEPVYWLSDCRQNRTTYNTAYVDGYDFITVDFEFGTDRYAYQLDGAWATGTEVPAGATDVKLAMKATPVYFTTYYRSDRGAFVSGSATKADNFGFHVVLGPDGLYYASADANYSENDIKLSNEVGVLDHVTFVMKLVKTEQTYTVGETTYNYYKAVKYAYVNGQFVNTGAVAEDKNGECVNLTMGGRLSFSVAAAEKTVDNFSFAIDNLCTNWYAEDYAYGENSLHDFFGDNFDESVAIYKCDDVLYQENYVTNVTDRWIEVDGTKYYNINAGIEAITNGCDIVLNANISYFAPSEDLESFNLELVGGSDFEISKGIFAFTPNGENSYSVEKVGAMANLALVDGIKFNLYVNAEQGTIKSISGIEEVTYAWHTENNCYEIVWASELDNYDPNVIKVYYSEGDSLVSNSITLDIGEYATIAVEEFECGSDELTLLYEILKYKEKALISGVIEAGPVDLTAKGDKILEGGKIRGTFKIGTNACGLRVHDVALGYAVPLLRDTLVVSYFDGENMVDLTVANGGIVDNTADSANQHLFVNIPVEFITETLTISFETPTDWDKDTETYTNTVPVVGTFSYAEETGLTAITALNARFAEHVDCTCSEIEVPAADAIDFSALEDQVSIMYDNAGIYVYGADDSLTVSYYYGADLVTLSVGDGIVKLADYEYYVHGIHAAFLADTVTVEVGGVSGTYNLAAFIDYAVETEPMIAEMLVEFEALLAEIKPNLEALKASKVELDAAMATLVDPVEALKETYEDLNDELEDLEENVNQLTRDLELFVDTPLWEEKKAELDAAVADRDAKAVAVAEAEEAYNNADAALKASAAYVQLTADIAQNAQAITDTEANIAEGEAAITEGYAIHKTIQAAIAEAEEMAEYAAAAKAFKVYTE